MIFFESEKIYGKNWPFCYFLCAFYVIFSHIFRKNSFSQKNVPCWYAALTSFYTANQIFASTHCVSSWLASQSILQYLHRIDWLSVIEILFCRIHQKGDCLLWKINPLIWCGTHLLCNLGDNRSVRFYLLFLRKMEARLERVRLPAYSVNDTVITRKRLSRQRVL